MTSALKKVKQKKSQHQQNIKKVQCTLTTHLIDAAKLGYGKTRNVNRMAENVAGEKGTLHKEKNIQRLVDFSHNFPYVKQIPRLMSVWMPYLFHDTLICGSIH